MARETPSAARDGRVYLAGPLFSEAERRFNERLASRIEDAGFATYLPQRDLPATEGLAELASGDMPAPRSEASRRLSEKIFRHDIGQVLEATAFVMILDGRVPDEGACVELGAAYAAKRLRGDSTLILGLRTDVRAAFEWTELNPMLTGAIDRCVSSIDEVVDALLAWREGVARAS